MPNRSHALFLLYMAPIRPKSSGVGGQQFTENVDRAAADSGYLLGFQPQLLPFLTTTNAVLEQLEFAPNHTIAFESSLGIIRNINCDEFQMAAALHP